MEFFCGIIVESNMHLKVKSPVIEGSIMKNKLSDFYGLSKKKVFDKRTNRMNPSRFWKYKTNGVGLIASWNQSHRTESLRIAKIFSTWRFWSASLIDTTSTAMICCSSIFSMKQSGQNWPCLRSSGFWKLLILSRNVPICGKRVSRWAFTYDQWLVRGAPLL